MFSFQHSHLHIQVHTRTQRLMSICKIILHTDILCIYITYILLDINHYLLICICLRTWLVLQMCNELGRVGREQTHPHHPHLDLVKFIGEWSSDDWRFWKRCSRISIFYICNHMLNTQLALCIWFKAGMKLQDATRPHKTFCSDCGEFRFAFGKYSLLSRERKDAWLENGEPQYQHDSGWCQLSRDVPMFFWGQ